MDTIDFWQQLAGPETLHMLNVQAKVKNVLSFNPASFNVFVNENGIYIVSTILEPLIKGQFIRFNKNQQFPDSDRVSDLADLSFQDDMIVLSLDRFQGTGATEICLLNTSLNEREKINYFLKKANWKKAPAQ